MGRPGETAGLARAAADWGVPRLARWARTVTRRPGRGLIVMYHRVAPEPHYLGLAVLPATFDTHLTLLRRRARVVPLLELVTRLADPRPLDEDWVAITFDDGYRDNLDVAAPILAAHGLPATVFVTTDYVDGVEIPLPDRIEYGIRGLWQRTVPGRRWSGIGSEPIDAMVRATLDHPGDLAALSRFTLALAAAEGATRRAAVTLLDTLGGDRPPATLMLDWPATRALLSGGIEIGSHTRSHPVLAQLDDAAAERELRESKTRLEAQLDRATPGLAFPYGGPDAYSDRTVALARRAGYHYACTTVRGANRPGDDPHRLRRLGVGRDASPELLDLKLALGGPARGRA